MKTAAILLLAVTVFTGQLQQSSAAPANSGSQTIGNPDGDKKTVDDLADGVDEVITNLIEELVKLVKKDIEISEAASARMVKAVKKALDSATGDKKERLTKWKDWVDDFKDLVAVTNKELLKAVITGTKEALGGILHDLSKAIKDTEKYLAEVSETNNLEGDLKDLMKDNFTNILNSAYAVEKAMKNVLAGKGVDAGADNAGENIEKIMEELVKLVKKDIEISEAASARMVKAVKKALDSATGDKKERLTKWKDWVDDFKDLVAVTNKELLKAVITGTKEALGGILHDLSKAIKDTEKYLAEVSETNNLEGDLKDLMKDNFTNILNSAYAVEKAMKNVLAGKGVDAGADNAGENIEKIMEELVKLVKKDIEISEAASARMVKAVKKALDSATGDKKERLTKWKDWVDDFKDLVAITNKELLKAVITGTKEALGGILHDLSKAIKDTEKYLAEVSETNNLEGDLKDLMKDNFTTILNSAYAVENAMKNVLAGKGVDAGADNAGENIEKIMEELVKLVKKDIKISEAASARMVKAVKKALDSATGDKKERLTKWKDWVDDFKDLVAVTNKELLKAVITGTKEALGGILHDLSKAIKDTEKYLAEVSETNNLEGDLKDLMKDNFTNILNSAYAVEKAMKNVLAGKGVDAGADNAGENIEKIMEELVKLVKKDIEISEAASARMVKAVKKALDSATGDKKERLTKWKDWVDDFKDLVAITNKELLKAVITGTKEALGGILHDLSKAIKDTEKYLAEVSETNNLEGDLKDLMKDNFTNILNSAYAVEKAMKNVLAGKGVDAGADNAGENIEKIMEELVKLVKKDIEISEAASARMVKAVKKALDSATGDKKERLTKWKDWVDDFKDLVAITNKELLKAVITGTKEALGGILHDLSKAIKDTEKYLAEVSETNNLEGDLKDLMKDNFTNILNSAYAVEKAMKNVLAGKGVDAGADNAGENIEKIMEELVKLVKKDIEISEAASARMVKAVKKALDSATGDKKERLTKWKDWVDDFKDLVAVTNKELLKAVITGTKEALGGILHDLSKAIKDTEKYLAEVSETNNLEGDLKDLMKENFTNILNSAYAVEKAMKNVLAGKGVDAGADNAGENIEKIMEELVKLVKKDIKISEAASARMVKAVKKALDSATGDKKERLTKWKDWVDDFKDLVAITNKELLKAVITGTKEALGGILHDLSKAIKDTEKYLAEVSETNNLEGDLKDLMKDNFTTILNSAYAVEKAMKNVLACKGVDAGADNAGENIEKIMEELVKLVKKDIKISEAASARMVKAVKKALDSATGDKKERLTKWKDWVDDFKDLVAVTNKELLKAVITGTKEALGGILHDLSKAIRDTEKYLAEVSETNNLEGDLKDLMKDNFTTILNSAYVILKAIKNAIPAQ